VPPVAQFEIGHDPEKPGRTPMVERYRLFAWQPMQRFCAEIMLKRDDESSRPEVTALSRQLGTGKPGAPQEHRAFFPPRRAGVQIFHPH
jgi:hypothetical protein